MSPEIAPGNRVRLDMHVHSVYSPDAVIEIDTIVRAWRTHRVLAMVCDHNTIRGSEEVFRRVREFDPDVPLIRAEEISTTEGEVIGAFLTEEITPGLSAGETIDQISEQGAVSIVPHPFCTFRTSAIDRRALDEAVDQVDLIEGYNARNTAPEANRTAQAYARTHKKNLTAGSDAHLPFELCRTFVELEPFEGPGDLLAHLRNGTVHFKTTTPAVHQVSRAVKAVKRSARQREYRKIWR
ncbi:putative metal-dependent phosphoesterase TrpH [Methanofollis sp. W23]|uniref:PHP domain-containing protein n=1 Tax=Methanofollis sp. W23 TaxID=2817849 RepID=UPI001AE97E3C|nr:PHP domain-containing protein [Methanofollis sp. W23]MBP2145259.1 putative metal-dependent phosphoesterase TrpH [Methanofollis sp. W23]